MDFWKWLGRADAIIGVTGFIWTVCVLFAVWIGRAPKARRSSLTNPYTVEEQYVPIFELRGIDRIRAELAHCIIRPERPVLGDLFGILAGFTIPIIYIWWRLELLSSPSRGGMFDTLFERINEFLIFADLGVIIGSVVLIIKHLTRAIWKLKR